MAEVPPGPVTVTSTAPLPPGTVTRSSVSESTENVAAVAPNATSVADVKPEPSTRTVPPPDSGPVVWLREVTVGAGA